jgi:hypothetical protein
VYHLGHAHSNNHTAIRVGLEPSVVVAARAAVRNGAGIVPRIEMKFAIMINHHADSGGDTSYADQRSISAFTLTADSVNLTASALTLRPGYRLLCHTNPTTRVGLVLCKKNNNKANLDSDTPRMSNRQDGDTGFHRLPATGPFH